MSEPHPLEGEERRLRRAYEARRGLEPRYSWVSPGHQLIMQSAERGLLGAMRRAEITSLGDARILEIGCGMGYWLRALLQWGAEPEHLVGVDLLAGRIAEARQRAANAVRLIVGSGARLPLRDASFDLVLQSTVFTSILDDRTRRLVAAEMLRVLRPTGAILWYDFFLNNPRNPDVRGVTKRELRRLFGGCRIQVRRTTLAPPLARAIAPRSWSLASALAEIPLLCSHLVGTIRPRVD